MWAANAVIGRLATELVPPMLLNFLRWALAGLLLLPLAHGVLRPGSSLWPHWRRFTWLGLLSVGVYNALQYLALKTSSPINVTLVAASMPIWIQLVGRCFFQAPVTRRQMLGALLSMAGVLLVLSRGQLQTLLQVQLVPGDLYILIAAICWAFYSWMLVRPGNEPASLRADWAAYLLAQIVFGLAWSALFAGAEWAVSRQPVVWGWPLAAILVFVAIGPAVLAYRAWGIGVQRAGPTLTSFFSNLTPLLTALMSAALLGEPPQLYHGGAFVLIVAGIVVSSLQREK